MFKSMGVDGSAQPCAGVHQPDGFRHTPIQHKKTAVYEMVKRESGALRREPLGSEIVGLVPKTALEMAADFFLQLENFSPRRYVRISFAAALGGAPR